MAHCFHDVPRTRFALGTYHRRTLGDAAEGFAQIACAANKRHFEVVLPDMIFFVCGRQHFALVDEIDFQRLQDLRLGEMADARLGHHRNAHRIHDLANDSRRCHARHPAFLADVRRHALERHDGAGPGLLGDAGLLGRGHVHNHATLEHLRESDFHSPLVLGISIARIHHELLARVSAPGLIAASPLSRCFLL